MSGKSSALSRHILGLAFAFSILLAREHLLRADQGVTGNVSVDVDPISVFYDALAPHGEWISTDEYGWVWIPSAYAVGANFVPYATDGHWIETDAGWFFESDFDWGWAPFHRTQQPCAPGSDRSAASRSHRPCSHRGRRGLRAADATKARRPPLGRSTCSAQSTGDSKRHQSTAPEPNRAWARPGHRSDQGPPGSAKARATASAGQSPPDD